MRKVIARWGQVGENTIVLRLTERMKDVNAWTLWRDIARQHFVSMDWSHIQTIDPMIMRGAEDDYCIHIKLRVNAHPDQIRQCLVELEGTWRKANLIGPGPGQFNMFDTDDLALANLADAAQERTDRNRVASCVAPLVHQPIAQPDEVRPKDYTHIVPVRVLRTEPTENVTGIRIPPATAKDDLGNLSIADLRELASPNLATAKKAYTRIQAQVSQMTNDGRAMVERGNALIAAGIRYAHVLDAAREYAGGVDG